MAFSTSINATLLGAMTDYTGKVVNDVVQRLADKFGFDYTEAQAFLAGGGIVVKFPPLERDKLPWTGIVREDCCKAIKKNGGLYTQCNGSIHELQWCKPCSKEVAKKGKPTCGQVQDRIDADILEYKVGNNQVKPYIDFMKKHAISREQVDQAAAEYGIVIDPRQFILKKRERKPRDMAAAIQADPPSIADDDYEEPAPVTPAPSPVTAPAPVTATAPAPSPVTATAPAPSPVTAPAPAPATVTAPAPAPSPVTAPAPAPATVTAPAPAPSPVTAPVAEVVTTQAPAPATTAPSPVAPATSPVTTELAPQAYINPDDIKDMDKKTVQAHCRARGISIESKGLVQLKRELSASLR
jgi:hypothetical protein